MPSPDLMQAKMFARLYEEGWPCPRQAEGAERFDDDIEAGLLQFAHRLQAAAPHGAGRHLAIGDGHEAQVVKAIEVEAFSPVCSLDLRCATARSTTCASYAQIEHADDPRVGAAVFLPGILQLHVPPLVIALADVDGLESAWSLFVQIIACTPACGRRVDERPSRVRRPPSVSEISYSCPQHIFQLNTPGSGQRSVMADFFRLSMNTRASADGGGGGQQVFVVAVHGEIFPDNSGRGARAAALPQPELRARAVVDFAEDPRPQVLLVDDAFRSLFSRIASARWRTASALIEDMLIEGLQFRLARLAPQHRADEAPRGRTRR